MLKPEEVNLVIAHKNCPDGFGAAWSVWMSRRENAEYVFEGYHGEIDRENLPDVTGKNVLMVDFAYQDIEIMNDLNAKANKMLLIDHHKSAKEKLEGKIDCDHIFDMEKSGARMAWNFMFPKKEVPELITHIEDRDIWKWEDSFSRAFLANLDSFPYDYEIYEKISNFSKKEYCYFVDEGRAILRYHDILVKKSVKSAVPGQIKTPDGVMHDCFITNSTSVDTVSDVGNRLAHDDVIAFIWGYNHHHKCYTASLRSVGTKDVSEIASQFGGGGHRNASGCSFDFDVKEIFYPYEKEEAKTAIEAMLESI